MRKYMKEIGGKTEQENEERRLLQDKEEGAPVPERKIRCNVEARKRLSIFSGKRWSSWPVWK
jgi:hypothetical protein